MNTARSVVLVEFNELCPPLMERFIADGKLPNFRRFRDESHVFVTEAKERYPYLDPWIQWVTVHAGVDFDDHGIEHLNEAHNLKQRYVWDLLSEAQFKVWVCGSMSVRYDATLNGAVLPDPWTTKVPPRPSELAPFFKFVQQNVLEYSNDRVPLTARDYAEFVAFMVRHGLSARTALAIASQLAEEKVTRAGRWKRATLLDRLQLDVFSHHFRTAKPHFSTFFSNSTAHFQHLYWRNMEPDLFEAKPSEADQKEYGGAILYGYQEMDAMLGRFMELAGKDTTLIFTTAISQQPCLKFEDIGGKQYYRPRDFEKFARALNLPASAKQAPIMSHEFYVELASEEEAKSVEALFASVRVVGKPGMVVERKGNVVLTGCRIWESLAEDTPFVVEKTGQTLRFFDLFYRVDGVKSGMHHPDGILWIRKPDREHAVHSDKVPLSSVAPTLLDMYSLPPAPFMKSPVLPGFSKIVC